MRGTGKRRKPAKNASDQKQDVGWEHATQVEVEGTLRIRCYYCLDNFACGIFRFKHHLTGTNHHIKSCVSVLTDVCQTMCNIVNDLQTNLIKKRTRGEEVLVEVGVQDTKRKKVLLGF